ncbi:dihydrodipicolinate synthase family protein [Cohaesibacter celericrescens]|uniref:dihydrodipicolinate synthase family protein n=1 Tax=Cohaesibacter celericrescens TaxID=2067669 RepID=UPI00356183FB
MTNSIAGIIPVVLTPFTDNNEIDWKGYEALIEWYIENGAQALFAVCQSSEMLFLSQDERYQLARFTAEKVAGRIPVMASGHVSDALEDQKKELASLLDTGIDAIVLVTNRLAPENAAPEVFRQNLDALLDFLPDDMPLGLYECPAPYRRLLSDDEIRYCAETGRFVILKDVSCDLETVKRRVAIVKESPLKICNANAAIAYPAILAGSAGFCGVFNNVHPDLYRWLQDEGEKHPELAQELAVFLVLAAALEPLGYPKLAKLYHQRLGTFSSTLSRVIPYDIEEKYWALQAMLDRVEQGSEQFRIKISALD